MGGSDDPSNIVELTIEEHAEAHRILYENYGKIQDKWAWLGLSGQIDKEEMLTEMFKKGSQTKVECPFCDREVSQHNLSRHVYSCTNGKLGTKANPNRKGITLTKWAGTLKGITNGKEDRRIKIDQEIPEGWWYGSIRKGTKYKPNK